MHRLSATALDPQQEESRWPAAAGSARDALRLEMRARRRRVPAVAAAAAGAAVARRLGHLPAYRSARRVVSYLAAEGEVSTEALHARCADEGRSLFLPDLEGEPRFLRWRPGQALSSRGGVRGPVEGAPLGCEGPEDPFVAVVPLVAWHPSGWRLGRGGGYYDRAFAQRPPGAILVGLAYEWQRVAKTWLEPWDVLLDYVVTDRRTVSCGHGERSESAGRRARREPFPFPNDLEN